MPIERARSIVTRPHRRHHIAGVGHNCGVLVGLALVNSAKSDFLSETSAIKSSLDSLESAVKGLSSNPWAGQIHTVSHGCVELRGLRHEPHGRHQFEVQLMLAVRRCYLAGEDEDRLHAD